MDLARMQQWKTILEHRQQLLSRRQAKYRDVDGLYPLHWACSGGPPVAVVQALLECYPSAARKVDQEGSSPLHFACHYGASASVVEALLSVNPDAIGLLDKYGRSPLYHAVDKSASMEVLQLLVRADASLITTPCLVWQQQQQQQEAPPPRAAAVRTPLYLAWTAVLSDYRARTSGKGKKWTKAQFLLQEACDDDDKPDQNLLMATIRMDLYLPAGVLELAVRSQGSSSSSLLYDGREALALAARMRQYSSARSRQVMECLLQAFPKAAAYDIIDTGQQQNALILAVESGKRWRQEGVDMLFAAAPEALQQRHTTTGLPPALLAATVVPQQAAPGDNDEEQQQLYYRFLSSPGDPFHLLSHKQQELLNRRPRRLIQQQQRPPEQKLDNLQDADTMQVETIFELVRANPAAVCW